jgi:hypothetical protein
MNALAIVLSLICAALMFRLPRRWAVLSLLLGACYLPTSQELEIGSLHFTAVRILVVAGLIRKVSQGERILGGINILDRMVILWGGWAVLSSFFHPIESPIARIGMVADHLGVYFLLRTFVQDAGDVENILKMTCVIFVPVAAAMLVERFTGKNCFALVFGGAQEAALRHGHFRARGPFGHAITAGTIGAVCWPLPMLLWRQDRKLSLIGIAACGAIVLASGSSGPVMTSLFILLGLALWKVRRHLRAIRWGFLLLIIVLNFSMKDPVYYLVARIDITGGSTGWHRAALIATTIAHFKEWWLVGTDITRHWMPTGVAWNERHTDLTNYYIAMGVWGGLLLMALFIAVITTGFAAVGRALKLSQNETFEDRFLIWTFGAILFGHVTTFFSVSYFDQSAVIFYLALAVIGSLVNVCLCRSLIPSPSLEPAAAAPLPHEPDLCHNR